MRKSTGTPSPAYQPEEQNCNILDPYSAGRENNGGSSITSQIDALLNAARSGEMDLAVGRENDREKSTENMTLQPEENLQRTA